MFTSLKLSKLLQENGFKGESEMAIDLNGKIGEYKYAIDEDDIFGDCGFYRCFDILNDLCVKYAKEMFGENGYYSDNKFTGIKTMEEANNRVEEFKKGLWYESYLEKSEIVLDLLQQNKQDEAEEYIIKNCILFK